MPLYKYNQFQKDNKKTLHTRTGRKQGTGAGRAHKWGDFGTTLGSFLSRSSDTEIGPALLCPLRIPPQECREQVNHKQQAAEQQLYPPIPH